MKNFSHTDLKLTHMERSLLLTDDYNRAFEGRPEFAYGFEAAQNSYNKLTFWQRVFKKDLGEVVIGRDQATVKWND